MTSAPVLALSKGLDEFMVYFDISRVGLGCVLMQNRRVIAYASRQLRITKKLPNSRLRVSCCGICLKNLRHYIYGMYVDVFTDHKSLQYVFSLCELNLCHRGWL